MSHDVFTGSAGMDCSTQQGWTHTVPDAVPVLGGRPERYAAARPATDRWHPVFWFVATTVGLLFLAGVSKFALELVLRALGLWS